MFTANLISEGINKEQGSIYWRVEFTDGVETIEKQYRFSIDSTLLQRKKAVKYDLDNLNATPETVEVGELDLSDAVDVVTPPTAKELAKQDFDASVNEYKYLKEMNAILPAVFTQWMLDNQVVICQQKYQTWQNTP